MKERKYKEDFKIVTRIDPNTGREKRTAVYKGKYYRLQLDAASLKKFNILCTALLAASLLALLVYMLLDSPSAYCMYVMPIAAIGLFPMLYWGMGLFSMWRAPEKLTSVQKETGVGRVLRSALGCMVFPSLAAIGDVVFLCLGGNLGDEWPALLMLLICAALSGVCFAKARGIYNGIQTVSNAKEDAKP